MINTYRKVIKNITGKETAGEIAQNQRNVEFAKETVDWMSENELLKKYKKIKDSWRSIKGENIVGKTMFRKSETKDFQKPDGKKGTYYQLIEVGDCVEFPSAITAPQHDTHSAISYSYMVKYKNNEDNKIYTENFYDDVLYVLNDYETGGARTKKVKRKPSKKKKLGKKLKLKTKKQQQISNNYKRR